MSRERLKRIWTSMKHRCHGRGTKDKVYAHYRDRGIKVCGEWRNDFDAFAEWSLANGYDENLTIDRIDCDGDYCPENCRWVTVSENNKNHYHSGIRPKAIKKERFKKPYLTEQEKAFVNGAMESPVLNKNPEICRWYRLVNAPDYLDSEDDQNEIMRLKKTIRILSIVFSMSPAKQSAFFELTRAVVKFQDAE